MDYQRLCRRLGYAFTNPELLRQALTHRSHSSRHNERLEFLGDSVLNCVIATELYRAFPRISEGDLSRIRAHLVKESSLAEIGFSLELGDYVGLGEGELKSGGFRRPSIVADALEAVFGAIYEESGFDAASRVIAGLYAERLRQVDPKTLGKDPKTLLQEYLQSRKIPLPRYSVTETTGEAHEQHFRVECLIAALDISTQGEGGSRRAAEQEAAKAAYELALQR